jgi:hypothetical protein
VASESPSTITPSRNVPVRLARGKAELRQAARVGHRRRVHPSFPASADARRPEQDQARASHRVVAALQGHAHERRAACDGLHAADERDGHESRNRDGRGRRDGRDGRGGRRRRGGGRARRGRAGAAAGVDTGEDGGVRPQGEEIGAVARRRRECEAALPDLRGDLRRAQRRIGEQPDEIGLAQRARVGLGRDGERGEEGEQERDNAKCRMMNAELPRQSEP